MAVEPVRVEVDFNARTRDGRIRARRERATGSVAVGDSVMLIDPEDGTQAVATVAEISDGVTVFDVDWASARPGVEPAVLVGPVRFTKVVSALVETNDVRCEGMYTLHKNQTATRVPGKSREVNA